MGSSALVRSQREQGESMGLRVIMVSVGRNGHTGQWESLGLNSSNNVSRFWTRKPFLIAWHMALEWFRPKAILA
jgi:hypothetical protein